MTNNNNNNNNNYEKETMTQAFPCEDGPKKIKRLRFLLKEFKMFPLKSLKNSF